MSMRLYGFLILSFLFLSCQNKAQEWVDASVHFYGQDQWDRVDIRFRFRQHDYALNRSLKGVVYTRKTLSKPYIVDSLFDDGRLIRYQDSIPQILSDSLQKIYAASVNSVLYFFQIPRVLNDPAVIKRKLPDTQIQGNTYHTLGVTFQQEGGGSDYEDEFRYWIDPKTFAIDYMAYRYLTDGGGIRFRVAKNRRDYDGAVFQDYSNFKPLSAAIKLDELPQLYESGKLIEISQIENSAITIMKGQ